jgi:pimeloyl-ACP methyl ester carboxylesterase
VLAIAVLPVQPAVATTIKTPVLLVHGLNNDRQVFGGSGWTSGLSGAVSGPRGFVLLKGKSDLFDASTPVYVLDYSGFEGAHGDIPTSAQAVDWAIGQIKKQTGASKVFIVVHSMGGLLTRVYLESLGGLKYRKDVAGFVTLNTPHMGCEFSDKGGFGLNEAASRFTAGWSTSKAGQQMDPDSGFLKELNSTDYSDPGVPSTFVVGNHYPLLGDGLLTSWEQIPYMTSAARLHRLGDYRIQFVDAVHSPEIGKLYYQAILAAQGKAAGSGPLLRPIVGAHEARTIAKTAYDRVATEFEAKAPQTPKAPSDSPHTPKQGSEERRAILDALRVPVERDVGRSVIFRIHHIEVNSGYAFVNAQPLQPNGREIDYSKTKLAQPYEEGWFDDWVGALLRWQGGRWKVVEYCIGATDYPCQEWVRERGVPESILQ